jgi:hypothetical protein
MKQLAAVLLVFVFAVSAEPVFSQSALPRLALMEFSVNTDDPKTRQDAITVRNLMESQMIASQRYQIVSGGEIDTILRTRQIQPDNVLPDEAIGKLRQQNIEYLVTGSVEALGEERMVTVKFFDIAAGSFSHSAAQFMSGTAGGLYSGVNLLAAKFFDEIPAGTGEEPYTPGGGRSYKIGDRGPGGGFIFFVGNGSYSEITPALGKGTWDEAVDMVKNHRGGGYTNWRLPSRIELDRAYQNLQKANLVDFGDDWFWSSSQTNVNYAWFQRFSDGYQVNNHKRSTGFVCAMRSF